MRRQKELNMKGEMPDIPALKLALFYLHLI